MSCSHGCSVPAVGLQSAERGSKLYSYALHFHISYCQCLPAVCSATRSFCGAQAECPQQVSCEIFMHPSDSCWLHQHVDQSG